MYGLNQEKPAALAVCSDKASKHLPTSNNATTATAARTSWTTFPRPVGYYMAGSSLFTKHILTM